MEKTKTGIGFDDNQNSFEAGKRAGKNAMQNLKGKKGGLVLAFCTGKHNYQKCFEGVRSEVGETPIIGGPAIGIITNDNLGYGGYQVGVAVLPNDLTCNSVAIGRLEKSEKKTGLALGKQLSAQRNPEEKMILLFYDSIKSPPPTPILNVSSHLLDGLEQGIGKKPPAIVGAGLIGSYSFDKGKTFCGANVAGQHAVATLLSGNCSVYTAIMHGCKPMSDYHTITRIEGSVVYEIDGRCALDVVDDLLGNQDWHKRLPLLLVTLGVNHGERYGPYNEKNYVNRLIFGIELKKKAIVLFEADLEKGEMFQFMRRSSKLMEESAERGTNEAMAYLNKNRREPFFALYIDCAGRTAAYSSAENEEASIIQKTIGKKVPLLGFYSGVEIAPLMGKSRGLDWTGVLLILSRRRQR